MASSNERKDFYANRTSAHLLRVLAIVEKKNVSDYDGEDLAKDELMERLDQHNMNTINMADKIVQKGGDVEGGQQAKQFDTKEVVAELLGEINKVVVTHIDNKVKPMGDAVKKTADEAQKAISETKLTLDKVVAEAGEEFKTIGNGIRAAINKDLPALIAKHAVDPKQLSALVTEAVDGQFVQLRKQAEEAGIKVKDGAAPEKKGTTVLAQLSTRPRVVKTVDAKAVFGMELNCLDGKPIMVDIWNDPECEAVNDDYVFNVEHLRAALLAMSKRPVCRNVFMFGETGTGKTEFCKQLSARLCRKLFRINFENGSDSYNFIGGERAKDASTIYKYGTFSLGLKHPGAIILLDELCFGKPGHLAALHATLEEGGKLTITETGERLVREEGVMIFAADNTNGTGDRSGRYDGLYTMNGALRRRFSYFIEFAYLPQSKEADIIAKHTGISKGAAMVVVKLMTALRAGARAGQLGDSPSLPHAEAFTELMIGGRQPRDAFEDAIVLSTAPEYREKLQELYAASFNEKEFLKLAA